jgi:hypothetical protein
MHLKLTNIGQITQADLAFGHLTVFVGPQATGKSIALQFLKLMVDAGHIQEELGRYGLDWSGKLPEFFDIYFGEGMRALWHNGQSAVTWKGKAVDLPKLVGRKQRNKDESLFFIPAQRVLTLARWLAAAIHGLFAGRSVRGPGVQRTVADAGREGIRRQRESVPAGSAIEEGIPRAAGTERLCQVSLAGRQIARAKAIGAGNVRQTAAVHGVVGRAARVRTTAPRTVLADAVDKSRRGGVISRWVVLEELEMGLHPRAISVLLLMVLELVARGYRVCLSSSFAPECSKRSGL